MKTKIFSLIALVALMSVPAFADYPSYESTVIKRQAGTRQSAPVRVIKLVRLAEQGVNAVSVVSGDALVYSLTSADGVSVNLTTTSADIAIAGIACTAIPTSDATGATSASSDEGRRNWGWIVVHGPANAKVSAGGTNANAAGDLWITSVDSGAITTPAVPGGGNVINDNTTSRRVAAAKGGFFFSAASASATSANVFVNLE